MAQTLPIRFLDTAAPPLDGMLTPQEAAAWLRMGVETLLEKSRGRRAEIPAFRPGHKTVLFHPRTIITKLALDAGVDPRVMAASLRMEGA